MVVFDEVQPLQMKSWRLPPTQQPHIVLWVFSRLDHTTSPCMYWSPRISATCGALFLSFGASPTHFVKWDTHAS
jgi:hypothetical protein